MPSVDDLIARLPATQDGDLMIADGVAYQADMSAGRVAYDADYLEKCEAYADSDVARAVHAGRCALLMRHLSAGASVLDIGAGSGAFIRDAQAWGFQMRGFDVIPETASLLRAQGLYADDAGQFDAVTMWDVLEHIEAPAQALASIRRGAMLFVSLPIYTDLSRVRESRHYRPGEHLYHWTAPGFIAWMRAHGLRLLEASNHETAAGRDSIGAFAFVRDLAACPCGGDTWVDSFDWPRKARQWFLRCEKCGGMSDAVQTSAQAERLSIRPEQAMECAA